jgi:hypothetical protein
LPSSLCVSSAVRYQPTPSLGNVGSPDGASHRRSGSTRASARLTTASKADRIVVLADGQIAEIGTHEKLLERGGSYAAMRAAFTGEAELVA